MLRQMRAHAVAAETAEIEVEVGVDWHELADLEAGRPFAQPVSRNKTGGVVVASDIKATQRRRQVEVKVARAGMSVWARKEYVLKPTPAPPTTTKRP